MLKNNLAPAFLEYSKKRLKCKHSKHADISIVVLIFMTVFICGAALFIFLINENQDVKKITSMSEINGIYAETDLIELFAYNVAKDIINKNNAINEAEFIDSFKKEYYGTLILSKDTLTSEQFSNYGQILNRLKDKNDYEITLVTDKDGRKLFFLLKGIEFRQDLSNLPDSSINSIEYTRDIRFEIPINSQ